MKGIYIHIPFCIQKCKYCDFCSYPALLDRREEYTEGVLGEIRSYAGFGYRADTVYFGGGTPTLMDDLCMGRIMEALYESFDIADGAEITIEANPCTVSSPKAVFLKNLGFNRISLGAQSFVDTELSALGRLHTSSDTVESYNIVRDAGFDNVSLDLMYAIPGQTMKSLSTSVSQVLKLQPEHVSCYGLKIEPGTPFGSMLSRGEIEEKSDDEYADMYEYIVSALSDKNYCLYELSNFAIADFESRHNSKYWKCEDYIGIGVAASSCLEGERFTHISDFDDYLRSRAYCERYSLTKEDSMSEFMFLGLRLTRHGVSKAEFERRFGQKIEDVYPAAISRHLRSGLLKECEDRYILSPKAYYISNSVLCDFV